MPNSENPESNSSSPKPRWRSRFLFGRGCGCLVGLSGAFLGGCFLIQNRLAPLIQQQLTQVLNRPLNVGNLESITPYSIRLGSTELPATATDPDAASIEAIEIKFDINGCRLLLCE